MSLQLLNLQIYIWLAKPPRGGGKCPVAPLWLRHCIRVKEVRGQVPGTTCNGARTNSAIKNRASNYIRAEREWRAGLSAPGAKGGGPKTPLAGVTYVTLASYARYVSYRLLSLLVHSSHLLSLGVTPLIESSRLRKYCKDN